MSVDINVKFKTRKFVLTAVTLFLTYVALFAGKLTGDQVVILVPWLIGIFAGANVVAKHNQFTENK